MNSDPGAPGFGLWALGFRPRAVTRRSFLRRAAGAVAAAALPASAYGRVSGAVERIGLGFLGTGRRGQELMGEVARGGPALNVRVAAVCDIWKLPREEALGAARAISAEAPAACRNSEELHAVKDLDAVVIATCDHQHAKMCVEAVKKGKHVFVETPLAHFLDDAVEVKKEAAASKRVVQVGDSRRDDPTIAAGAEVIRSGRLGRLLGIDLGRSSSDARLWRREDEVARLREADTDWKRFLLHLPEEKFDPRKEVEFRLFWPYSSGIPGQWLCPLIDVVPPLADDPFPRSCMASGGVYSLRDGRKNADRLTVVFQYPRGFPVVFQAAMVSHDDSVTEVYHFEGGDLDLRAGVVTRPGGAPGARIREELRPPADHRGGGGLRGFLDCVREGRQPRSGVQAGFEHSVAICMAMESLNSGKRIGFDPLKEKFAGG
jgi:predicted dehydrogenase